MKTLPPSNSSPSRETAILFTFRLGSQAWNYTSDGRAVTIGSTTWAPANIKYDEIRSTGGPDDRPVVVHAGIIEPFIRYVAHDLPDEIKIEIRRAWRDALDSIDSADVIFLGVVDNVDDSADGLDMECRGPLAKLDQQFPSVIVGPTCSLETYSDECGLHAADFSVRGQILVINRTGVVVAEAAGKPDGYFAHGYADAQGIRLDIMSHTGDTVELSVPPTFWRVGDFVVLVAGDDHTCDTCKNKFNNVVNFLGLGIATPDRNPVTQKIT